MLALDDSRWADYRHAYGPAGDVPEMLRRLALEPLPRRGRTPREQRERPDPWDEIWGSLCHQGTRYTATYAAVPHIVEIAATVSPSDRLMFMVFLGSVAIPPEGRVPEELVNDLERAIAKARGLALETLLSGSHSERDAVYLVTALAQLHGSIRDVYPDFERVVNEGDAMCPSCGVDFNLMPPLGRD